MGSRFRTRFLPATKPQPKDAASIGQTNHQYTIEEAVAWGIDNTLITGLNYLNFVEVEDSYFMGCTLL